MPRGGPQPGSGRPKKADEEKAQRAAYGCLMARYGSAEAAMDAALESGQPALMKFVYEWAFGKPTEKIQSDTTILLPKINFFNYDETEQGSGENSEGV